MLATEFVEAYPRLLEPDEIHMGEHAPYILKAQQYSHAFGRSLHNYLSGRPQRKPEVSKNGPIEEHVETLDDYEAWIDHDAPEMMASIQQAPLEIQARAINEFNFHQLNKVMVRTMWPPIWKGWDNKEKRQDTINITQDRLALQGVQYYKQRMDAIERAGGTHALYEGDTKLIHQALTGVMQEIDAGIILLNFIHKYPNLTLVPAPLQFERSKKQTNVDYIAINVDDPKRAVGIQVKSHLRQEHVAVADPDRVVFIDGDTDLQNVRVVRRRKQSSNKSIAAWPGLVAMHRVQGLRSYGRVRNYVGDSKPLFKIRALATELTRDIQFVDYRAISQVIGARILAKM